MDVLLIDPLVPEALAWLQERYQVVYQPELADDPVALRQAVAEARAIVVPPHVIVSAEFLEHAPNLQMVARMQISSDNTDLEACSRRGVRVLQARSATVRSNAEYLLYGLLMLYRRGMVSALLGRRLAQVRMGRELAGSTVVPAAPASHRGRSARRSRQPWRCARGQAPQRGGRERRTPSRARRPALRRFR